MEQVKNKVSRISKIESLIELENEGLAREVQSIVLEAKDIFKIKRLLALKSNGRVDDERQYYYRISTKLNLDNYKELFKDLDKHFVSKKNIDKNQSNTIENKEILSERKSDEIVISPNELPLDIKERLKEYIYLFDSMIGSIHIYLRDKNDYKKNIGKLKSIEKSLNNNAIKIKIHILCESKIIEEMTSREKSEFVEFLNKY